jgi:hypothetical protein
MFKVTATLGILMAAVSMLPAFAANKGGPGTAGKPVSADKPQPASAQKGNCGTACATAPAKTNTNIKKDLDQGFLRR